jgi:hypothetical protein
MTLFKRPHADTFPPGGQVELRTECRIQPSIRQYVNVPKLFVSAVRKSPTLNTLSTSISASILAVRTGAPLYLKRCISAPANYFSFLEIDAQSFHEPFLAPHQRARIIAARLLQVLLRLVDPVTTAPACLCKWNQRSNRICGMKRSSATVEPCFRSRIGPVGSARPTKSGSWSGKLILR